ncbi:hypothetical protein CYMTET_25940, partial [Cymbomonas tetramitiformis]
MPEARACADKGGGVVYVESNAMRVSLVLSSSSLWNNTARSSGGVFHVTASGASLQLKVAYFSSNHAGERGAVLFMHGTNAATVVTNCSMIANSALIGGGVLELGEASSIVTASTLSNNACDGCEGGVVNLVGGAKAEFEDCVLHSNFALYGGVAFLADLSHLGLDRSSVSGNKARNNGGVVYATDSSSLVSQNSTFSHSGAPSLLRADPYARWPLAMVEAEHREVSQLSAARQVAQPEDEKQSWMELGGVPLEGGHFSAHNTWEGAGTCSWAVVTAATSGIEVCRGFPETWETACAADR